MNQSKVNKNNETVRKMLHEYMNMRKDLRKDVAKVFTHEQNIIIDLRGFVIVHLDR